jgi:hypothetical protein
MASVVRRLLDLEEKSKVGAESVPVTPIGRGGLYALMAVTLAFLVRFHPTNQFLFSLVGLFIVSLVSNATPFFGASYTLIATVELISFGFSIEAFVLIVGITAAGAAMGKLVIYGGAKGFQRQLSRNKNVQLLGGWLQHRRFLWAVFLTALIPALPLDDYIYIGAGAAKARLGPMVSVTVAAKLVKSTLEIALEFFGIVNITNLTRHVLGISSFEFSIILTIVFIILGIFLFKFDWERVLPRGLIAGSSSSPTPDGGT